MPCKSTVSGRAPELRARYTTAPAKPALAGNSSLAASGTRSSDARTGLTRHSAQITAFTPNRRARDRSMTSLLGRSRNTKRHATKRPFTPTVNPCSENAASETHRPSDEECDELSGTQCTASAESIACRRDLNGASRCGVSPAEARQNGSYFLLPVKSLSELRIGFGVARGGGTLGP